MYSRSKRRQSTDSDLDAADREAARMLASDADSDGTVRRNWRERAIGGMSASEAVAVAGDVKLAHLRLGNRLAHLAGACAAEDGLSRGSWIRSIVAREVAARTGESYEELLEPLGLHQPRSRGPRRVR